MFWQMYILVILACGVVLINAVAKMFITHFPAVKGEPAPFWSTWLKFPANKECVEERVRTFMTLMYFGQILNVVILIILATLGDYTM